jgi:uncharacterized protein YigE (DUF2233 family)
MRLRAGAAMLFVSALGPGAGAAPPDRPVEEGGVTVIPVDTAIRQPALFLKDEQGRPLRSFDRLAAYLARSGRRLRFAMNAGMYEENGDPVGLLVIDGKTIRPLNRRDAKGNFYLKPNGVFALTEAGPRVVAAEDYAGLGSRVRFATQSGPLLVRDGTIRGSIRRGRRSRATASARSGRRRISSSATSR